MCGRGEKVEARKSGEKNEKMGCLVGEEKWLKGKWSGREIIWAPPIINPPNSSCLPNNYRGRAFPSHLLFGSLPFLSSLPNIALEPFLIAFSSC